MPPDAQTLIAAPPEAILALYRRPQDWPLWDPELSAVDLPGGLTPGATGTLTPRNGPKARITVARVAPDGFAVTTRLPLCTMTFDHSLTPEGAATRARHWVRFDGPLAPLFRRLIGPGLAAGLGATMAGLKAAAEG